MQTLSHTDVTHAYPFETYFEKQRARIQPVSYPRVVSDVWEATIVTNSECICRERERVAV